MERGPEALPAPVSKAFQALKTPGAGFHRAGPSDPQLLLAPGRGGEALQATERLLEVEALGCRLLLRLVSLLGLLRLGENPRPLLLALPLLQLSDECTGGLAEVPPANRLRPCGWSVLEVSSQRRQ